MLLLLSGEIVERLEFFERQQQIQMEFAISVTIIPY